jgi:DNA polymerase-3 subunit alpha
MTFVHLHRHGHYSLLDGCGFPDQYAERAAELGQPALAITDHGTLAGVLEHIVACEAVGIKPIVGMEAYFSPDAKVHNDTNKEYWHLVLLAANAEGYRSLLRLSTESYRELNFYYKPRVDWEMLKRLGDGLIASTSCLSGYAPWCFMKGDAEGAERHMRELTRIFPDRWYVELQPHDIPEQRQVNVAMVNAASHLGVPVVAATDAHYPYQDWADTHDVLVMMNTGQTLDTREKAKEVGQEYMAFTGDTFYLMSTDEVMSTFKANHKDLPKALVEEAVKNTAEVAGWVESFDIDRSPKVPKATTSLMEAESLVRTWCEEGLVRIGREADDEYRDRMEFEIGVLRDKGVLDYFVIIGDLVRWAKDQGIRVGAGRGSAAGCLVSYLIRITGIDPIGHGLLFERFLNPTRAELPDIDIDFQHNRRDEVKLYLRARWGADYVAEIGAYQTFGMRSALQYPARVLLVPYERVMRVTKTMEDGTGDMKLSDIRNISPDLDVFAWEFPDTWKHAVRLEGMVKSHGKHAAGVVITDTPIADVMPTMRGHDGSTVTQWSERAEFPIITTYGFLKIDVLSTDSLTIQDTCTQLVKKLRGRVVDFEDVKQFPVNADPHDVEEDVITAFGQKRNLGIFQFESSGISGMLKDIQPTFLGDIIACNALYRPGALEGGMAFDYGDRKNGRQPIVYWHESLEPFLRETYGVMAYQEQVMQVCSALGGFSLAEADIVRKAMTKWQSTKIKTNKGRGEMNAMAKKFVAGCKEKGIPEAQAKDIWEKVLQFSIYGFNKSHSAGYALQAYHDMWLKLRYPLEFYASLLTWEDGKVPAVIREATANGIQVKPPDVNASESTFALDRNSIRFGFEAIKHVGDSSANEIMRARQDGPFTSFDDFMSRITIAKCNARVQTALVECGAFDSLGLRHDWDDARRHEAELRLLGYSLTRKRPVDTHKAMIAKRIVDDSTLARYDEGTEVMVGGEIVNVKEIVTKKGDKMAFVDLVFVNSSYNCTFFPRVFDRYWHFLSEGNAILALGSWDPERGVVQVENAVAVEVLAAEIAKKNGG